MKQWATTTVTLGDLAKFCGLILVVGGFLLAEDRKVSGAIAIGENNLKELTEHKAQQVTEFQEIKQALNGINLKVDRLFIPDTKTLQRINSK